MEYAVQVTKKKIKNMIIRITREGEVKVSVPYGVPSARVSDFIKSKEQWIERNLEKVLRGTQNRPRDFENGDRIRILGKHYRLQIIISRDSRIELFPDEEEPLALLYVPMYNDAGTRRVILYNWLKDKLISLLYELNKKYGTLTGYLPREVRVREMKSLWGSCNVRERKITYNFHLIEKPLEAIEYVVLHEISHMPYPDHQTGFWEFVSKYMPDWRTRKRLLGEERRETP